MRTSWPEHPRNNNNNNNNRHTTRHKNANYKQKVCKTSHTNITLHDQNNQLIILVKE